MRRKIKSGINYFLVLVFLTLGVIGIILPVVPQTIFFVIALTILSFEIPAVEKYFEKYLNSETYIGKTYLSLRKKIEKYLG